MNERISTGANFSRAALCAALLSLALPALATPPALPAPAPLHFSPPQSRRFTLKNGITVYLLEDRQLPVVHGSAIVRTGTFYDDAKKPGTAALLGVTMRSGGSTGYDADAMNEALEYLGASVESGMGDESGSVSFDCLSRDIGSVLPIFADDLMHPVFRADKVEVEKQQILEGLLRRNDEPREIARREGRRILFGAQHPYGRRLEPENIKALTRRDLSAFHAAYFKPRAVTLALSGDFETQAMLAKLEEVFGGWKDEAPAALPAVPPVPQGAPKVVLIAKDDVTQTALRAVETSFKRHDPDHFAFEVANDVLGGDSFVSRLFRDIRSRRGLAYGVGSFFAEWDQAGYFGAVCGTRNEKAVEALGGVLDELKGMRENAPNVEELAIAKDAIVNGFVFHYETADQINSERAELAYYGYAPDYLDTYLDHVRAVDSAAALAAARKWLRPEQLLILVVGPSSLEKDLAAFGPVEVRKPD